MYELYENNEKNEINFIPELLYLFVEALGEDIQSLVAFASVCKHFYQVSLLGFKNLSTPYLDPVLGWKEFVPENKDKPLDNYVFFRIQNKLIDKAGCLDYVHRNLLGTVPAKKKFGEIFANNSAFNHKLITYCLDKNLCNTADSLNKTILFKLIDFSFFDLASLVIVHPNFKKINYRHIGIGTLGTSSALDNSIIAWADEKVSLDFIHTLLKYGAQCPELTNKFLCYYSFSDFFISQCFMSYISDTVGNLKEWENLIYLLIGYGFIFKDFKDNVKELCSNLNLRNIPLLFSNVESNQLVEIKLQIDQFLQAVHNRIQSNPPVGKVLVNLDEEILDTGIDEESIIDEDLSRESDIQCRMN